MFSGIVQCRGRVIRMQARGQLRRFTLRPDAGKWNLRIGESVAVSGVCLTVAKLAKGSFVVEAVKETLAATTLGHLRKGDCVNLERSLKYGQEIGGHFVTGHIDDQGLIKAIEKRRKHVALKIKIPKNIKRFIAPKGSVTVEGISLTVQAVAGALMSVVIIPHTWKVTTLADRKIGDPVNLEVDLIARYLDCFGEALKASKKKSSLSRKLLARQGF